MTLNGLYQHQDLTTPATINNSVVDFSSLSEIEQSSLIEARERLSGAYAPQTRNHRGAAILLSTADGEQVTAYGNNADTSMRSKNCAEKNALSDAFFSHNLRKLVSIDTVITISKREHLDAAAEPPVAPCGTCRSLFLSMSDQLDLSKTSVIMASSDLHEIRTTKLLSLLPYPTISSIASVLSHSNPDPRTNHYPLSQSALWNGTVSSAFPLSQDQIQKLFDTAHAAGESSYNLRGITDRVGAALITIDNQVVAGSSIMIDGLVGGLSAVSAAIARAQSELLTRVFKAVFVVAHGDEDSLTIPLTGDDRQAIFDRSQLLNFDIPVFLGLANSSTVLCMPISKLFPHAEGPNDSRSTRNNIEFYKS